MKTLITALLFVSFSAQANLCARYEARTERALALEALSQHINMSMNEICQSPRILDVEITPTQTINRQGEIVRQMAIYFHYSEESCQYLLNREDLTLMKSKCYLTW